VGGSRAEVVDHARRPGETTSRDYHLELDSSWLLTLSLLPRVMDGSRGAMQADMRYRWLTLWSRTERMIRITNVNRDWGMSNREMLSKAL
jgi:hypothetical protein